MALSQVLHPLSLPACLRSMPPAFIAPVLSTGTLTGSTGPRERPCLPHRLITPAPEEGTITAIIAFSDRPAPGPHPAALLAAVRPEVSPHLRAAVAAASVE